MHLRICPDCRRRTLTSEDVGRILCAGLPRTVGDDPAARAAIMHAIEAQRASTDQIKRHVSRSRARWQAAAAVALIALLTAGVIFHQPVSRATGRGRALIVEFGGGHTNKPAITSKDGTLPGEQLSIATTTNSDDIDQLVFQAVIPPAILRDLTVTAVSVLSAELLTVEYRNERGLVLLVTELPTSGFPMQLDLANFAQLTVGETEVLVERNPLTDGIYRLLWARSGVTFEVRAVETNDPEFSDSEARELVQLFTRAQDQGIER